MNRMPPLTPNRMQLFGLSVLWFGMVPGMTASYENIQADKSLEMLILHKRLFARSKNMELAKKHEIVHNQDNKERVSAPIAGCRALGTSFRISHIRCVPHTPAIDVCLVESQQPCAYDFLPRGKPRGVPNVAAVAFQPVKHGVGHDDIT